MQLIEQKNQPLPPKITERDINGFSRYDAERIERARRQVESGDGTTHEIVEAR